MMTSDRLSYEIKRVVDNSPEFRQTLDDNVIFRFVVDNLFNDDRAENVVNLLHNLCVDIVKCQERVGREEDEDIFGSAYYHGCSVLVYYESGELEIAIDNAYVFIEGKALTVGNQDFPYDEEKYEISSQEDGFERIAIRTIAGRVIEVYHG